MGQSSTLWMMAGFVALLVMGYIRDSGFTLSGDINRRKEAPMKKAKESIKALVFGILNASWAIGASIMAAPLSA